MVRAWPLRITLFVVTNLAVLVVFGIVVSLFDLGGRLGTSPTVLIAFAAVFGFGGALVSLAMSKRMALWSTKARILANPASQGERWLVSTVQELTHGAGLGAPDVAIYDSPVPNAFATGMRRNHALVAVSSGLLDAMQPDEVRAVLAHEVSHVANGDMVTMALLQGVLNTFVIAGARVVGSLVDSALSGGRERRGGMGYFLATIVAQILFGFLASLVVMAYSRGREFRADAGAAELVGPQPMIAALRQLAQPGDTVSDLPQDLAAFGIQGGVLAGMLRTHPPIQARIDALHALQTS